MARTYRTESPFGGFPHLFVATAAYQFHPNYTHSLAAAMPALVQEGIAVDLCHIAEHCHVDDARNAMVREFLMSILKKGEEGRAFARKMFNIFAMDATPLGAIEPRQAMSLTDLQTAALVWRHQIEEFIGLLASSPAAASLDYASFIGDPADYLRAAATALKLEIDSAALAAVASGPVFKTDAKFAASPFTAQTRKAANDDLEFRHGAEISMIAQWAEKLRLSRDLKSPLPNALRPER